MEIFLIKALQLMLAISLLVLLHEGGHFFFAKLFGIRVEKFYLFFDPWFHLFEFKPKNSHTAYGLGWLPLGGYCKIAGMIDESFDTEQLKKPAQSWEFRSKPAWQRLLVMIGGVLVNFLLALFIYSMILFSWGESYIPVKAMSQGMVFNKEAKALGFQDHDILVGTEDGEFKDYNVDLFRTLSEAKRVDIIRDGKPMSLNLPGEINLLGMIKAQPTFCSPYIPAVADSVIPSTPASEAGLKNGDAILSINGKDIKSYSDFTNEIGRLADVLATVQSPADSLRIRTVKFVVEHAKAKDDTTMAALRDTLSATLTADLKLGFIPKSLYSMYQPVTKEYSFLESIPAGIGYGIDVLSGYVDDMKYVFSSDGVKSLGGFGALGNLFPAQWDWYVFWKMTAFFSIMLAFMNILPIPVLDGGHVLFLVYEIVTRRKPSEKFMLYAEYVGFGILVLLMVVANLNDILRALGYM